MHAIFMALLLMLVDCMVGCVSKTAEVSGMTMLPQHSQDIEKPKFHQVVETAIPIVLPNSTGELKADIFRPLKQIAPKTLVIIVPGQGNVSRRGEVSSNGIDTYKAPREMSLQWAKALSDQGYFVLSYDKRTCNNKINPICANNDQKDIDEDGIVALSRDLDQAYSFASSKLKNGSDGVRLVLLSSTQGAQTIILSEVAKKISGIVLFSPIIGDLETMWIDGLGQAADQTKNLSEKNKLLNRKESMAEFFASLKRGAFLETANVMGASVKFWISWLSASRQTFSQLLKNDRPTMLIFNENDRFSPRALVKDLERQAQRQKLIIRSFPDSDRNFAGQTELPKPVVTAVIAFIETLMPVSP